ncbi:MAG: tetraacyldisaccharide 4'-kinase [Desulfuromonadales bacterium]|nr:tetraacyldisaccharide 4'-kinase [Desulfuromonadales bacterium]
MNHLERFHQRLVSSGPTGFLETVLFLLLVPLSVLYGSLMWVRSLLYRVNLFRVTSATIPVISVGNLAVGGTGKTPFVDYLLAYFSARGIRPAVISRGYGGRFSGNVGVVCAGNGPLMPPEQCGDEPYLLAQKHPGAQVLIASRRRDAIRHLAATAKVDLIILDDAFQHLSVARDLNIVLLDAARPFGNGFPLPAGLLREFPVALRRADLLVMTRAETIDNHPGRFALPTVACRHHLSRTLRTLGGETTELDSLVNKRGVAFAGIANPPAFFAGLLAEGLQLFEQVAFADHAAYGAREFERLAALGDSADYFITTEKDAVKLADLPFTKPCYIVSLELKLLQDEALAEKLVEICREVKHGVE